MWNNDPPGAALDERRPGKVNKLYGGTMHNTKRLIKYRIQMSNGKILNAGTGKDSWFSLEKARALVNYHKGERIVESDGVNILWEVL